MCDLIISAVPITLLDHLFPKCIIHINKAIEQAPNDLCIEAIEKELYSGSKMLVIVSEESNVIAVNILEFEQYSTGHKVLCIPIVGGERMDEWIERFLNIAEAIGRDLKCDELRGMACRKGWMRIVKPFGWYNVYDVVGCKINYNEVES